MSGCGFHLAFLPSRGSCRREGLAVERVLPSRGSCRREGRAKRKPRETRLFSFFAPRCWWSSRFFALLLVVVACCEKREAGFLALDAKHPPASCRLVFCDRVPFFWWRAAACSLLFLGPCRSRFLSFPCPRFLVFLPCRFLVFLPCRFLVFLPS